MSIVYAVGETLLDIIFRDKKPVSATPGGSMLNTAVSLGRMGCNVSFISDYGRDMTGDLIDSFLEENRVDRGFVKRYAHHKSGLALAYLNDVNDASYEFYKDFPEKRMEDVVIPFQKDDILLFGSFFALTDNVRSALIRFLTSAKESGSLIMYDPNFRIPHLHDLEHLRPIIIENIHFADIVRGSDEDFRLIFGVSDALSAYRKVKEFGCSILVYTANKNGVDIITPEQSVHLDIPRLNVVSTIGAGDNFNAGLLYSFLSHKYSAEKILHLTDNEWRKAGDTGIKFASDVCMHYENYISEEFRMSGI